MSCLGCNAIAEHPKALLDGRTVCTNCPDWRHEAEARFIARLPSSATRGAWLDDIQKKRGKAAADELRGFIKANWKELRA